MNNNDYYSQIEMYKKEYEVYQEFADFINQVLTKACAIYAPKAITQVRVKSVSSFAEKIVRKHGQYVNPIREFDDLCGARIITQTRLELDDLREFIEKHFIFDSSKELDKTATLDSNEFGYMSIHYSISLPDDEAMLNIQIPDRIRGLTAEIQLRTMLQHIWSEMDHDRFYKATYKVPNELKRDNYRLAAIIENTDKMFSNLVSDVDYFEENFTSYSSSEEKIKEVETLKVIYKNEPLESNLPSIALNIANYYKGLYNFEEVVNTLENHTTFDFERYSMLNAKINVEYAYAQCILNQNSDVDVFKKYQNILIQLTDIKKIYDLSFLSKKEKNFEVSVVRKLAKTFEFSKEWKQAKKYYFKAYEYDSKNPYVFAKCLEFYDEDTVKLPFIQQAILDAIKTLQNHVLIEVEMPKAYFVLGRLRTMLGDYVNGLNDYVSGLYFCRESKTQAELVERLIAEELSYVNRFDYEKHWQHVRILLSRYLAYDHKSIRQKGASLIVLIDHRHLFEDYRPFLRQSLTNLKKEVTLIATSQAKNHNYFTFSLSKLKNEPLRNFDYETKSMIDILNMIEHNLEHQPIMIDLRTTHEEDQVQKLLSTFGFHQVVFNPLLQNLSRNHINLPKDPMVLKAYMIKMNRSVNESKISDEDALRVASKVHELYESNRVVRAMSWDDLDEDRKQIHIDHVTFMEHVLLHGEYEVVPIGDDNDSLIEEEIKTEMAKLEHGGWVISRIIQGWKYGEKRDDNLKLNPYLTDWDQLPEKVHETDKKMVENYYRILKELGLTIKKIDKK